ncbi:MAG: nitroreductase/quinone reductase family protein [Actinomycetota bacterium]|jgi:deazaflavin-dependent oxidoreductase (nitroreductase family)|nr:nitroreductase/quinone reductase family protein [Actinomycetota bacterium]
MEHSPDPGGPTPVATAPRYRRPGRPTRLLNGVVHGLTRLGLSVAGSRVLEVTGRSSGLPRRTPVNVLHLDGVEHLVSPRGTTEWVRNVRAADGQLTLQLGRHRDRRVAVEVTGEQRVAVLRAYLARWSWEVGMFFDGVGPDSSDDELAAAADRHPVFRLQPVPADDT